MTRREEILDAAREAVMKDRNTDYGNPEDNFQDIANLWSSYLKPVVVITPHDVAVMMVLLKVSRLAKSPSKADHWVDIAGYAACGYEAAVGK